MLPSLLYKNKKPENPALPPDAPQVFADLGLRAVTDAMTGGPNTDAAGAYEIQKIMLGLPAPRPDDVYFRQAVTRDALNNPGLIFRLRDTLEAGLEKYDDARRQSLPGFARFTPAAGRLRAAANQTRIIFTLCGEVKNILSELRAGSRSEGLLDYIAAFDSFCPGGFAERAVGECAKFDETADATRVTLSARIGPGMKGVSYIIRGAETEAARKKKARNGKNRVLLETVSHQLKANELRDSAFARLANLAGAVAEQTAAEMKNLRRELIFYAGCARLCGELEKTGVTVCFPSVIESGGDVLNFKGLADAALALNTGTKPVTNALDLDGARLCVVTGANQGGKSTFLRSLGCAVVMARCGMFVAADKFQTSAVSRVFTHFCMPEDDSMDGGKLDEELERLSSIIDRIGPRSLVLMNESFSSTSEREGTLAAREIIGALCGLGVRVAYVTHFYEFARGAEGRDGVALLRAERNDDGTRPFTIKPGLSLKTSYGMDLFEKLIG